jgi:hypothetical protein
MGEPIAERGCRSDIGNVQNAFRKEIVGAAFRITFIWSATLPLLSC